MTCTRSTPRLIIRSSGVLKDGGSVCLSTNLGTFYIDNRVASKRAGRDGVIWTSVRGGFGKPLADKVLAQEIKSAYHQTFARHHLADRA